MSLTSITSEIKKTHPHAGKKAVKTEEKKEDIPEPEPLKEEPVKPRVDTALKEYIDEVTLQVQPYPTQSSQAKHLAVYVSNQMGGPQSDSNSLSHELHIAQLKADLKSNVIPIGFVKRGIFYHRALLFKVLADRIGMPCSLVRGEYNRAWNEVTLVKDGKTSHYLVDLMKEPGKLLEVGGHAAGAYKKL